MYKVEIYLKTGAVLSLDMEEFSITPNSYEGGAQNVKWEGTAGKTQLLYVDPAEIVAVTAKK